VAGKVMTVRGPIPSSVIGQTGMHEHILIDVFRVSRLSDFLLNDESMAIDEVMHFKNAGGGTIVDVTTPDLGRDPMALQRISEAADVHLIMGCGWYRQPFYPAEIDQTTVEAIAGQIVHDLGVGVGETGIRAGIIGEIGSDRSYVSAQEERVFRGAARAQKRTGVALTTHTSFSPVGLQQLDIIEEEGADLRRVIIGHCDTYLNLDYHEAIIQRGAYVQFDSVGSSYIYPDWKRVELLLKLLKRGYESQILLSCDVCRKSYWRAYGGIGYDYWITGFLPQLRQAGVSEEQIEMITIENPRRVLEQ